MFLTLVGVSNLDDTPKTVNTVKKENKLESSKLVVSTGNKLIK